MRSINNEYGSYFFACYKSFSFIRLQNNSNNNENKNSDFVVIDAFFVLDACVYEMYKMY